MWASEGQRLLAEVLRSTTQTDVARRIDVHPSMVSTYRSGVAVPTRWTVRKAFLDVCKIGLDTWDEPARARQPSEA